MTGWHLDSCCLAATALAPLLYATGVTRLWRRAGLGHGVSPAQVALFAGGWLAVGVPVLSPLHGLGRQVFALHMTEHELLIAVAAPLLVLARPGPALLWGLPDRLRPAFRQLARPAVRGPWRVLSGPVVATALHGLALWVWHMPALFQRALANESLHAAQHVAFLVTALLFWWSVLSPVAQRRAPLAGAMALLATTLHTVLLGALLTFARGVWYPAALDPAAICGLSRLEDQQLAGILMGGPGGLTYLAAALWLIGRRLLPDPPGLTDAAARA